MHNVMSCKIQAKHMQLPSLVQELNGVREKNSKMVATYRGFIK